MVQSQHVQEPSSRSQTRKGIRTQPVQANSVDPLSTGLNSNSRPKKPLPPSLRSLRNLQSSLEPAASRSEGSRQLAASLPHLEKRSKFQQPPSKTLTGKEKRKFLFFECIRY